MTPQQAIDEAKRLATQYAIRITWHGRDRQQQRTAPMNDIRNALSTCKSATYDGAEQTWRFYGGVDLDGERLEVVLALEDGEGRLVTVIRPH
jgi:hypothetical protein